MGNQDTDNRLWGLLGFFLPPAGFILYFVWTVERPQDARHALRGAIWGAIVYMMLHLVISILWFVWFVPFFEMFFSMTH
jgi:hypothetical protein